MDNVTNNRPTTFDIEGAINNAPPSHYKIAIIATCSTLATGLGTVGSLLLTGSLERVGPLAVKHDYFIECSYNQITKQRLGCKQVDDSSNKATTLGLIGTASLFVAGILAAHAIKLARS